MKTKCLSYEYWIGRIASLRPLTFTRYGDGEFACITKKRQRNCDGHTLANAQMREELVQSILQPGEREDYIRGIWMDKRCRPVDKFGQRWGRWASNHCPHITWYDGLMFNFRNNEGRNFQLIEMMRSLKQSIVVIGPKHLRRLSDEVFEYAGFIQVPYKTAYHDRERILQEALEFRQPVTYSIHAGPPAPIFAWRLWQAVGDKAQILDLGSIFDGYCGKKTRRAWREFITPERRQLNLYGHNVPAAA